MVLLSNPGEHFGGGEFVLVENRPRSQSQVRVVPVKQGDLVIFPGTERPILGKQKWLRAKVRHGVSELSWGERTSVGIIFHDAQ